ncbi:nuclear transport factor 2 family protein [Gemmata sp.]|uniref:nuclear transport factor 2 family protein n=1 Tax=Gemmata sp. TaxID=1914242 RepID=UPI003F72F666
MRTLTQFALAVALLTAAAPARAEDATKDVEKAIAALNDAFKAGDGALVKALETDDHLSVTTWGGTQTRDESIKTLPDLKLTAYTPAKLKITVLGPDAALVTYALELKGTFKGKDVPAKNFASAVWVRKGGKWLEAYYQETPVEK